MRERPRMVAAPAPAPGSDWLEAEVARLVARLAEVVRGTAAAADLPAVQALDLLAQADRARPAGPERGGAWAGLDGTDATHPLRRLARALALTPVEVDLVVLAGIPEEHEALAAALRLLHPRGEPRPTLALAARMLCQHAGERRWLREVLECGAAARAGLLRAPGDAPFWERNLLLPDRLWSALVGLDVPLPGQRPATAARATVGLGPWLATPPVRAALHALTSDVRATVLVLADQPERALARANALVAHAGATALILEVPPGLPVELERELALVALARAAVPVLALRPGDGPTATGLPLADHPGPVVLAARRGLVQPRGDRPVLSVTAEPLSLEARAETWRAQLPELARDADTLAVRFSLEPSGVAEVASDLRLYGALAGRTPGLGDVATSVRARAGLSAGAGVQLVHPAASWDDLVLAPDRAQQLKEAVSRLHHQGRVLESWGFLRGRRGARGVRLLFAGPSGTGKTLSAEVMAHELGVDLLVVDISRVVSKWIGETEKNLAEVFDVAEQAQAVLLFDEADALFGRRTEVSDAHDRYANLETAYLLTRLEQFEGLAILSTNLRQNIDPAFIRRLEFLVEFDQPSPPERAALWRCHLPPGAPMDPAVDLGELARLYPVVGGFIRNAAVAAGFAAAAEGVSINRQHLVRAIRREYEKAGRAFPGQPPGAGGG
jgi:hypothetical protein